MSEREPAAARPLEEHRSAIVVGASSGIGAALARRLARAGYHLGLVARRQDRLERLAAEVEAEYGVRARGYSHDVRQTAEVPELLQRILRDLGGLDLFVYAAGIQYPTDPERYDADQELETLRVNTLGAAAWINPVAQRFRQIGGGHIVGIGSIAGDRGRRGMAAYSASKAALHTYLEAMRNRLARHGVRVTTIKPGQVRTELLKNADRVRSPISAEAAAEGIWRAIERGAQTAYVPRRWALIALAIRNLPSFIFRRMSL